MIGNRFYNFGLLFTALGFFAVLALDITVPAFALSIMALMRWLIAPAGLPGMEGEAA